jgi:hypothetical protein
LHLRPFERQLIGFFLDSIQLIKTSGLMAAMSELWPSNTRLEGCSLPRRSSTAGRNA